MLAVLDLFLAPFVYLAARLVRFSRRATFERLPKSARMIEKVNIYPLIDIPYEPLFNLDRIERPLDAERDLPGVVFDDARILETLKTLGHRDEVLTLPRDARAAALTTSGFHFDNPYFCEGDAEIAYALLRARPPKRVIEIGCGWSSRVIAQALDRNGISSPRATHVCIDPYVATDAQEFGATHLRAPVEAVPLRTFDVLEAGDTLFIDSSHMIRPQGDVLFLFQRVLPRLKPGVTVHVHDIFTPADYPDALVRRHRIFWNEQYLLEVFLAAGGAYDVILPVHHLWRRHRAALIEACPHLALAPKNPMPSSFWMVRR